MNNIELFYDLVYDASIVYYHSLKKDYFSCLTKVFLDLKKDFNPNKLDEDSIDKLVSIYKKIDKLNLTNEEKRISTQLLNILAFKTEKKDLNTLLPESIIYQFVYIIKNIQKNKKILDTNFITFNPVCLIKNYLDCNIDCICNNLLNVNLGYAQFLFMDLDINLSYQKINETYLDYFDIVYGDISFLDNPYEIILKRLENLVDGYFIYLVNNDFFKKMDQDILLKIKDVSTILGFVKQPKEFFQKDNIGKSIVIGRKVVSSKEIVLVELDKTLKDIEKINLIIGG